MGLVVEKQKMIYRSDLIQNRHKLYIFGDNRMRVGMGGQAGQMRGEPNAFGFATKYTPSMDSGAFFSDSEDVIEFIYEEYRNLLSKIGDGNYKIVVLPEDGIGTGLSRMPEKCPMVFELMIGLLDDLGDYEDGKGTQF